MFRNLTHETETPAQTETPAASGLLELGSPVPRPLASLGPPRISLALRFSLSVRNSFYYSPCRVLWRMSLIGPGQLTRLGVGEAALLSLLLQRSAYSHASACVPLQHAPSPPHRYKHICCCWRALLSQSPSPCLRRRCMPFHRISASKHHGISESKLLCCSSGSRFSTTQPLEPPRPCSAPPCLQRQWHQRTRSKARQWWLVAFSLTSSLARWCAAKVPCSSEVHVSHLFCRVSAQYCWGNFLSYAPQSLLFFDGWLIQA